MREDHLGKMGDKRGPRDWVRSKYMVHWWKKHNETHYFTQLTWSSKDHWWNNYNNKTQNSEITYSATADWEVFRSAHILFLFCEIIFVFECIWICICKLNILWLQGKAPLWQKEYTLIIPDLNCEKSKVF